MTQEQLDFVRDNMNLFTTSIRFTQEQTTTIYSIYNAITGEQKRPTSCGRCVSNTLKRILFEYNKLTND